MINIDEQKSVEILEKVLKESVLKYRRTNPGDEGGFFYIDENGKRKKFTENIFIKRSIKADMAKSNSIESEDNNDQRRISRND